MKTNKLSFSILALCIVTTIAKAQDKIIKRNGDTLKVTITKSTPDLVEFTYPNESAINSEYKNSLAKIIYSSGREENCAGAKKLVTINSAKDWEKVEITTNEEDVKGLIKLGNVTGTSGWGGYGEGLGDKNARKDLQKHAAKLGGSIVLLQEKLNKWGVKLIGIAYK